VPEVEDKNEVSAIEKVKNGEVSRRKLLSAAGGTVALGAFLAACGSDDDSSSSNSGSSGTTGSTDSSMGADDSTAMFGEGDLGILNYALTLEYLEAAFYDEAAKKGKFKNRYVKDFAAAVKKDEDAHVKLLKSILGKKAVKSPKFDFGKTTSNEDLFVATAFALENTGVSAYSGQAFNIKDPAVLAGALSIVTIEARHAGLIGELYKGKRGIAPDGPTDKAVGAKATLKAVGKTGFIKS